MKPAVLQGIPVEGTGIPQQGFGQGRGAPLHPPQHGHMGHFGVPVAGPGVPGHMKGRGIQSERGKGRGRGDRGQQPLGPRQSLDGSQAGIFCVTQIVVPMPMSETFLDMTLLKVL